MAPSDLTALQITLSLTFIQKASLYALPRVELRLLLLLLLLSSLLSSVKAGP